MTDATVCLGYLEPSRFLAGELTLDADSAEAGLRQRIADPLGISVEDAAAGVVDVLLARTVGAVRQITVERGRDPRAFSLLAFGGAGPLFASLLAREMGIQEVIIPLAPGGFSAWGMLSADVVNDYSRTDLRGLDEVSSEELESLFASITDEARASLQDQGIEPAGAVLQRQLELRYSGQEHAIIIDVGEELDNARLRSDFEDAFRIRYGHVMSDTPLQILNLRVRGIGRSRRPELPQLAQPEGDVSRALIERREAYCFDRRARVTFEVYERQRLGPGDRIQGPAIIDEGTSTTVIHSEQSVSVDEYGHLLIQVGES